jgi:creatinase
MAMPNLINIDNGERVRHSFSDGEYANRIAKLRAMMASKSVDTVVFTSYHNINYYSDFLYCSFGRFYSLVVTQNKSVIIAANIDGGQPWRKGVCDRAVIYTDWQSGNYFRAIAQEVPNKGRVGLEFDHMPLERMEKIKTVLPNVEFANIAADCMKLRMIKSAEEIEFIKNGAQVCDVGGAALVAAVHEGVPEHEVALASTQAMVREIAKRYPHTELMDSWTWFQSGINTDGAHNPVTTRKVQKGDILSLNCFSMISGYYTALERTLFFGEVDAASLKLWEVNVRVHEEGQKLVKPGVRCCDVAHELNKIYE